MRTTFAGVLVVASTNLALEAFAIDLSLWRGIALSLAVILFAQATALLVAIEVTHMAKKQDLS